MFKVIYHPKVHSDLKNIDHANVELIRRAIEEKIAYKPTDYGKPLRRTLKNLRSLRVGDFRIVYAVRGRELIVLIVIVGKRDIVYKKVKKRV